MSSSTPPIGHTRAGLPLGFSAYLLWGGFPLYFKILEPAGPVEIVGHRVLWATVFCVVVMLVTWRWGALRDVLRSPRLLGPLVLAGALITVNWLIYILAVLTDRVVDASLGYFINPLVTVLLAVVLLKERLRAMQWAALIIASSAVVVIAVGYGTIPWIALTLALSFGLYGYVKKRVAGEVPALEGLAIETGAIAPLALGYLVWLQVTGQAHFGGYGGWHAVALIGAGVVTAIPLLLFNAATRRLPLSVIGMLQYITPIIQFLIGVFIFREEMGTARWIGFVLVWIALVILTVDGLVANRALRRFLGRGRREA